MYGVIRRYWPQFLFAAVISILLSSWISSREAVLNSDGICYLQSAFTMNHSFSAAINLCDQAKWPFYSALIFGLSHLTHLSLTVSAYMLNGFFSLISIVTFILIIRLFTENKTILWLSAFVILFAHEFNGVKQYIIRDHGFWAFYLLSILFLISYFRKPTWTYALSWSASLIIATLFRVEGVIFLLLMPLITFLNFRQTFSQSVKSFLQLNVLTMLGGMLFFILLLHHQSLSRLSEVQTQFQHGVHIIFQMFQAKKAALSQYVLGPDNSRDAGLVLFFMLASWYVITLISSVSLIYAILIFHAFRKKLSFAAYPECLVLYGYVLINIVVTAAFLVENLFLSKRYLIALALVLMLWVPFALYDLLQGWQKNKWPVVLVALLFLISAVSGIVDFGYSKNYLRYSGDWLAEHVPKEAKIYSNDYQVMYYSQHFGNDIFTKWREFSTQNIIANGAWREYDYLALHGDKKTILLQIPQLIPVQVFKNKRGDQVDIYEVKRSAL